MPCRTEPVVVHAMVPDLDAALGRYRAAGFPVGAQTAEFPDGLRTGFVTLWPQYVELMEVHDQAAFDACGDEVADLRAGLARRRPCSVELVSEDTLALRRALVGRGWHLEEAFESRRSDTPPDAPADFVAVGLPRLSGPPASVYTSARFPTLARPLQVGPAGIYGVARWTVTAADATGVQAAWDDVVTPGPVAVRVLSPQAWADESGEHEADALVEVTLLVEDLARAVASLRAGGWEDEPTTGPDPVLRHRDDGVRYALRELPVHVWRARREDSTGIRHDIERVS